MSFLVSTLAAMFKYGKTTPPLNLEDFTLIRPTTTQREEFVTKHNPAECLRHLVQQIVGATCQKNILRLAWKIEQLGNDVLNAQLETFLAPLMDCLYRSTEPQMIRLRRLLRKEDEEFQELLEIYKKTIIEDKLFVLVSRTSSPSLSEPLYPIKHLRRLAERVSDSTTNPELLRMTQRVAQLNDEQLDERFVSLNTPLMYPLFFSEKRKLLNLRHELIAEGSECPEIFHPLAWTYQTYNREGRRVQRLDHSRFLEAINQIKTLRQELEQDAQAILNAWEGIEDVGDPEEKTDIVREILADMQTFEAKEKKLRLLEAHVNIFRQFIDERKQAIDNSESVTEWMIVGSAIAFVSIGVFSAYLNIPYFVLNSVMNGGAVVDGFSLSFLGVGPSMAVSALAKRIYDWRCGQQLRCRPTIEFEGISLPQQVYNPAGFSAIYQFDPISTGPVRAALGLPSRTSGKLMLIREGDKREFRFSMKGNLAHLNFADLYAIRANLLKALKFYRLDPEQCLNFLLMLSRLPVTRGDTSSAKAIGFITPNVMREIFAPVIHHCQFAPHLEKHEIPFLTIDEGDTDDELDETSVMDSLDV